MIARKSMSLNNLSRRRSISAVWQSVLGVLIKITVCSEVNPVTGFWNGEKCRHWCRRHWRRPPISSSPMLPMPLPPTAAARMFSFRPTTLRQQRLGGIKKIDPMRHFSKKVLQSTWRCNFPSFYYDRSINRPTNQPTNRWTGRVIWKTIHLIRCFSLCSVLYIYVYIYIYINIHT